LLNELVDELYERVSRREYRFKTVAVKIVRSIFQLKQEKHHIQIISQGKKV